MKYFTAFMLACLLIFFHGCNQMPVDEESEKQAIIDVIEKETQAFMDYDFETLASMYVHDSLDTRLTAGRDNYVFLQGWDKTSSYLKMLIKRDEQTDNSHITVGKSNYRIKLYPNSAWVTCDEKWTYRYEHDTTEINSIQVRFMEKVDGEWKISLLSFIGTSGYEEIEQEEEFME